MESLEEIIGAMDAVSLKDMDRVSLMDRVDTKFYFHERLLPTILMSIKKDYKVLEILGERFMRYESDYYDTADMKMLSWHQNGKLNRYKVRKRRYLVSGEAFLEVKFKSNKGITKKTRRRDENNSSKNESFIAENTPFKLVDLEHVISNQFQRLMLVNNNNAERVTIDLNLGFHNGCDPLLSLKDLVVLEIKSERHLGMTELQRSLKFLHIYPNGFSKFITGMYMFHPELKFNRFKSRFLSVNKTIEKNLL